MHCKPDFNFLKLKHLQIISAIATPDPETRSRIAIVLVICSISNKDHKQTSNLNPNNDETLNLLSQNPTCEKTSTVEK